MEKEKINVSFFESNGEKLIAATEIPLNQLPDTFEIDTKMHVGEGEWSIASAQPNTKAEFAKIGKLDLFLKEDKVSVNVKEIRYSLPTIHIAIGKAQKAKSMKNIFIISEDDWRQVEFISSSFIREIHQEFIDIHQIYDDNKEELGFAKVHLRKRVLFPLENQKILLTDLLQYFSTSNIYKAVGYDTEREIISDSFAFSVEENLTLWGVCDEKKTVASLNLIITNKISSHLCNKMKKFLEEKELYIVDWVKTSIVGKGRNSLESLLGT